MTQHGGDELGRLRELRRFVDEWRRRHTHPAEDLIYGLDGYEYELRASDIAALLDVVEAAQTRDLSGHPELAAAIKRFSALSSITAEETPE